MHIAIDARRYDSGMWIYLSSLIHHLQDIDTSSEYTLIAHADKMKEFHIHATNFHVMPTDVAIENHLSGEWMRHVVLPRRLLARGVEVFHDPGYFLPVLGGRLRKVVTFHDMVPFLHQETNSRKFFTYMRSVMRVSARIADVIIADSLNTKQDIIRILNVPERKIEVIYLAARELFQPLDDCDRIHAACRKIGLAGPYILNVGTIEPRKNIPRLLEAFHHLRKTCSIPHKLVIVGPMGWLYKPVQHKIHRLGLDKHVLLPGYVEDNDLVSLYNGTDLFIFPSLYEGFGLPPLEAIACGAPVAASNTSCLPEILGDAAVYFDPYDPDQITSAIMQIIHQPRFAGELRRRGPLRAANFTWRRTAELTMRIYQNIS
ncbi:glycosyltransferase family 4 protein [bacterium]|nr:glycosyltransferase family 4 protein [candidate division CSSED10-310 bacterium]